MAEEKKKARLGKRGCKQTNKQTNKQLDKSKTKKYQNKTNTAKPRKK